MRGRDLIETRGGLAARCDAVRRDATRSGAKRPHIASPGLGCMTQSTQSRSPLTCRVT